MQEYSDIDPELVQSKDESYRKEITGTTAGLVIGDRAFEQRKISTFIYDLASEWRSITGLPFVFAIWISNKPLLPDFIERFNQANANGDRKSTRLNSSHITISYAVFCLKKKKKNKK